MPAVGAELDPKDRAVMLSTARFLVRIEVPDSDGFIDITRSELLAVGTECSTRHVVRWALELKGKSPTVVASQSFNSPGRLLLNSPAGGRWLVP